MCLIHRKKEKEIEKEIEIVIEIDAKIKKILLDVRTEIGKSENKETVLLNFFYSKIKSCH